jgi:hypothetical protein
VSMSAVGLCSCCCCCCCPACRPDSLLSPPPNLPGNHPSQSSISRPSALSPLSFLSFTPSHSFSSSIPKSLPPSSSGSSTFTLSRCWHHSHSLLHSSLRLYRRPIIQSSSGASPSLSSPSSSMLKSATSQAVSRPYVDAPLG